MALGMMVNYLPPERQQRWVAAADAAFDEVWLEGGWIHMTSAVLAGSRAPVGSGILTAYLHEPMQVARMASQLAGLSAGRFRLGIGGAVQAPRSLQFARDTSHGAPRMAEYIRLLRTYWAGPAGRFGGRFYDIDVAVEKPPHDIPIYVGALTPRMMRMAGEVADGVCGHPFWPARWARDVIVPSVAAGRQAAGRPGRVPVSGWIFTAIDSDRAEARRDVKRYYTRVFGMPAMQPIAAAMGWQAQFAAVQEARARGDETAALDAFSDEAVDEVALTGTPDQVRRDYADRWQGIYDVPVFFTPGGPRVDGYLQGILDTFGKGSRG